MNKNIWSPDTCGCKLEFEWNKDVPSEQRVHTPTRIIKTCSIHKRFTSVMGLAKRLFSENNTKNTVHLIALERFPELQEKEDVYIWRFNADRELEVTFPTLTEADVNALKGLVAANLAQKLKGAEKGLPLSLEARNIRFVAEQATA